MPKPRNIEPEDFEILLNWLDPDRESAGLLYEQIRDRLIKIFIARGSPEAETLADETIDRVILKAKDLSDNYVGEKPISYFCAVARRVYHESLRQNRKMQAALDSLDGDGLVTPGVKARCLGACLKNLTSEQKTLLLEYYDPEKNKRRAHRHELADKYGLDGNNLRVKIYRIKLILEECVEQCSKKFR